MSHRSSEFLGILKRTEELLRELVYVNRIKISNLFLIYLNYLNYLKYLKYLINFFYNFIQKHSIELQSVIYAWRCNGAVCWYSNQH